MRIISSLNHRMAYWTGSNWSYIPNCAAVFMSYDEAMAAIVSNRRKNRLTDDTWNLAGIVS